MRETKGIMIVGVGGQGTLLASRILGNVLIGQGYDVKMSEVHGMSQRGGSVVTYVKYGDKVYSPLVDLGEADYILAFERLEAARWISYLKDGGKLILNDRRISPMPVITGAMEYPSDVVEKISSKGVNIIASDALSMAIEAGSAKSVNVVMIGILSALADFDEDVWQKALEECVKPKFLELNKKAFALGREYALKNIK
ncbi:MAG: indolepyruvate oxidoreductase subunit beta [Clostridiales bacterium]|jgi:indolepyruvate ferredoxin oxidoreductase beta subunit|nr:indolepyruvate oxidoreductase subunit beta [Clostridiales bacterium]